MGIWEFIERVPTEVRFGVNFIVLFFFGSKFQTAAFDRIRRFRIDPIVGLWVFACAAFWYSVIVWFWWAKKSLIFPLFLLNERLEVMLFFEMSILAAFIGIYLTRQKKN